LLDPGATPLDQLRARQLFGPLQRASTSRLGTLLQGSLAVCDYDFDFWNDLSPAFWASLAVAVFIVVRHRANIGRLLRGTEPKFKGKTQKETP
jgi:glycerol-3-phosphate acyltransferase PlsY